MARKRDVGPESRCKYCGLPQPIASVICGECMQTVQACRTALLLLLKKQYIEQVSDHCWTFKPGAQRIAEVIYDSMEGWGPRVLDKAVKAA